MKQYQFIRLVGSFLKTLRLFGYIFLFNLAFIASSVASTYEVKKLASNFLTTYPVLDFVYGPLLDGTTGVVWIGFGDDSRDIFYYHYPYEQNITNDNDFDTYAISVDVNRYSSIVWQLRHSTITSEIYLSDSSDPENIIHLSSEEDMSSHPRINDNGQVVWVTGDGYNSYIYLYDINRADGNSVEKISERGEAHNPQINNSGYVVWEETVGDSRDPKGEIFFYDGSTTVNISNSSDSNDFSPRIGNGKQVAWISDDGHDKEIRFWDGNEVKNISNNDVDDSQMEMSSSGHIVWSSFVGNNREIFLYKDGLKNNISNTEKDDYNPHVNKNGYVVWDNNEGGIYLYDGNEDSRVNTVGAEGRMPRINRINIIAWGGGGNVYQAIPISTPRLGDKTPFPGFLICPDDSTRLCPFEAMLKAPELQISTDHGFYRESYDVTEPCDGCAFSNHRQFSYLPETLVRVRRATFPILFGKADSKIFTQKLNTLKSTLEKQPIGLRFSKSMRKATLGEISTYLKKKKNADALKNRLLATLNAMELDWRVPKLKTQKIKSGANQTAQFDGVAWATFHKVKKSGALSLKVENGVPALSKAHELGWPFAKYNMKFKGQVDGAIDITFYYGGLGFGGKRPSPRLLQWDGKAYTDVTTVINYESQTITGRVNKLSTFVIMNKAKIDGRYISVGKHQAKKQEKQKSK